MDSPAIADKAGKTIRLRGAYQRPAARGSCREFWCSLRSLFQPVNYVFKLRLTPLALSIPLVTAACILTVPGLLKTRFRHASKNLVSSSTLRRPVGHPGTVSRARSSPECVVMVFQSGRRRSGRSQAATIQHQPYGLNSRASRRSGCNAFSLFIPIPGSRL